MSKARVALVAASVVAIPVVCACGAPAGTSACSAADKIQVQESIARVEARAGVHSHYASGPTCSNSDPNGLVSERKYPYADGRQSAIESALSANGWTSTSAPGDDDYQAQIKSGRLTTQVDLLARQNEEGGFTITATFTSIQAPG